MCKLRRITHKPYIKSFGLYLFRERFDRVYTSIKSTKTKFIPIVKAKLMLISFCFSFSKVPDNGCCLCWKNPGKCNHNISHILQPKSWHSQVICEWFCYKRQWEICADDYWRCFRGTKCYCYNNWSRGRWLCKLLVGCYKHYWYHRS